jgi:peptide/nickel transport system permease protein
MSAPAVALPSARRIAWLRRRRALARTWKEYRHSVPGMLGLVILVVFVGMALAAPLLADEAGLHAVNVTDNPAWASPSEFSPLGTDQLGR